jgi:hypothetical protein
MNSGICHAPAEIIGEAGVSGDAKPDVEVAPEMAGGAAGDGKVSLCSTFHRICFYGSERESVEESILGGFLKSDEFDLGRSQTLCLE